MRAKRSRKTPTLFGELFRIIKDEYLCVSHKEMADKTGLDPSTISSYATSRQGANPDNCTKIIKHFTKLAENLSENRKIQLAGYIKYCIDISSLVENQKASILKKVKIEHLIEDALYAANKRKTKFQIVDTDNPKLIDKYINPKDCMVLPENTNSIDEHEYYYNKLKDFIEDKFTILINQNKKSDDGSKANIIKEYINSEDSLNNKSKSIKSKAFNLMLESAEDGYIPAFYEIAKMYENGTGTEINLKGAFSWYLLAANEGFTPAYVEVAECYRLGKGIEKDIHEALKWYQEAVDEGMIDSKYELSLLLNE